MGKKLGTAALFLGAFMLALAALSKFYMYDQLAVVPLNTQSTSISATAPGADATYLDIGAGPKVVDGPLRSTRVVTGDVEASKAASKDLGREIAVWDTYSCTDKPDFNCASGDTPLSGTTDRVAFDRNTGETVAWNGSKGEEGTRSESGGAKVEPASFEGLYFKFPFDTQKKTYKFWDGTIDKATPATYVGEGTIKGLKVYKFEQTIAPTKTGTIEVPGSLVGSDQATVTADRVYSNVRRFSVEPVTGVVIVGGESQDGYLELDGKRVLTTTKATLSYTDQNTKDTVDTYKPKAFLLSAVKTWVPVGGAILGIILIGLGLMSHRDGDDSDFRRADRGELVGSR